MFFWAETYCALDPFSFCVCVCVCVCKGEGGGVGRSQGGEHSLVTLYYVVIVYKQKSSTFLTIKIARTETGEKKRLI